MSASDRLLEKVVQTEQGCWEWRGARNHRGYGRFWFQGRQRAAHRVAYELFVEPIPDGLEIDHLCFNPCCVNPAHLEAVTPRENSARYVATLTHCKHGHEFSPENTHFADGRRTCRICRREKSKRWRVRNRARLIAAKRARRAAERIAARPNRACLVCGDNIAERHGLARYCSEACRLGRRMAA